MAGYVVSEHEVKASARANDTASVRLMIGPGQGCKRLEQRVVRFAPGRSQPQALEDRQSVLYVVAGTGRLIVGDDVEELEPQTGVYVVAGETFQIEHSGPGDLVVVLVTAPQELSTVPTNGRTVRWEDRPSLPASPDREFRFLVDKDVGCHDITQFVGVIPSGCAPTHSHTYDEVVYVIEGEGLLHLNGEKTPIAAGSCIHLPPLVEHCLENTGASPMRVLGVFHPAGDPASRASQGL
ncbi:MAG: cupin domain-containing protein [Actinomycetota bacterium]|nr:cupin domain-containing protein [Actinomycetota bacterium]